MENDKSTVARTINPDCWFCIAGKRHILDDVLDDARQSYLHPYRGHGFTKETGWTHEDLGAKKQ